MVMDSKFYENDIHATTIEEVEFVRSPYYDLAKSQYMKGEDEVHDLLEDIGMKHAMMNPMTEVMLSPHPTPENLAFTRYQDRVDATDSEKHIFQFPRGEPLRRSVGGDLFKVQKAAEHWKNVRRSKSYIA